MNLSKPTLPAAILKQASLGAGAKRALKRFNGHVAAHGGALPAMPVTRQVLRLADRRMAKDARHAAKFAAAKGRVKGGMAVVA